MASSTRLSFFHLCHGYLGFASCRFVYCCVAITALIHTHVDFVAKGYIAGIFVGKGEFFDWMTLGAV